MRLCVCKCVVHAVVREIKTKNAFKEKETKIEHQLTFICIYSIFRNCIHLFSIVVNQ